MEINTRCAGARQFSRDIPDTASEAAKIGTALHKLTEVAWSNNKPASAYIGRKFNGVEITPDHVDLVQKALNYIGSLPGEIHIEQFVDLRPLVEDCWGTADIISIHGTTLTIGDNKFGHSPVFANGNRQMLTYAAGALIALDGHHAIETVKLVIVQPTLNQIDEHTVDVAEVRKFITFLAERIKMALEPDAPRTPGERQCRWCRARHICPELADYNLNALSSEFEDLTSADTLSNERIAELLPKFDLIKKWMKAVEHHAYTTVRQGGSIPHHKLVKGRRPGRKWNGTDEVLERLTAALGDAATTSQIISPTQAEKLIGKEFGASFGDLVIQGEPSQILVTEDDPRPAISQEFPLIVS